MANPFADVKHDDWDGDEIEDVENPDPDELFVPSDHKEDDDVAP